MTNKVVYQKEDTVQNINDRYLEGIKKTVVEALDKIPESDRLDMLIRDDAIFRIFTEFEALYRVIFGSQIDLLMELYKKNEYIFKYDIRKLFDDQMAKRKIDFDVDFEKWLNFVVTQGLIKEDVDNSELASLLLAGNVYRITDKGVSFLTFITNRGYDMKKEGI